MTSSPNIHDIDWTPHRLTSLEQAQARTRFVRRLRKGLIALLVILISIFMAFLIRNAYDRARANKTTLNSGEMVAMLNPKFMGRDGNGQPYEIRAQSATRRRSDTDLIDMVNPRLIDNFKTEISAPLGLFDRSNETLELYENVVLSDAKGYVFNSEHAQIDIKTGFVSGVKPLDGAGPAGDIRADSYQIDHGQDIIRFNGNVRHTILESKPDVREEQE